MKRLLGFILFLIMGGVFFSEKIQANIEEFKTTDRAVQYLSQANAPLGPGQDLSTPVVPAAQSPSGGIASCKFYRPDQKPGGQYCVQDGSECQEALSYQSPQLISIFEEAAVKSGIPAEVLAGVARFESTVPLQVSATGKSYSLLNYSDGDVKAMEEFSKRANFDNIDETIGANKALCPRSPTGALGIVQVQPPANFIDEMQKRGILKLPNQDAAKNNSNAATAKGAFSELGIRLGAQMIGVPPDQLTLEHFCNPRTALLLGAGVMKAKAGGSWNPPADEASYEKYIKNMAGGYYGNDANTQQYINGLWQSVKECKGGVPSSPGQSAGSNTSFSGSAKSNKACVKVGNPTIPNPCLATVGATSFGNGPSGNFTYYCQGDPKWDEKGNACSIGQVGCGPTSVAMIMSYFGDLIDPAGMFQLYKQNGLLSCNDGSYPALVNIWLKKQEYLVGPNLVVDGVLDPVAAKTYINRGYLILGSSQVFKGQRGVRFPHIFVVQDVDPATRIMVMRDPENCSYATGQEISNNKYQQIISDKIPNWAYAYPIQRERVKKGADEILQN